LTLLPRARAEVSDIALLGDQANLMAGAVTASTQAGPSMWYNPARLAFATDQRVMFAVSGVGVALRHYKVPGLVTAPNTNLDAKTTEILALPRATTLVVRAHRPRLHWGLGLFVPTRQDVVLQAGHNQDSSAANFNAYAIRERRASFHATGSVSYELNKRVQLGASLGYVTYSYFRMSQLTTAAYDSATGTASAVVTSSAQHDNLGYGLRPTLGISVQLVEGLTLGVSVSPPTMLFYAHVRDVSSSVSAADSGVIRLTPSARDHRGGTWDAVEPAIGRVGLAYATERMLWEIDGEISGGARSTDFDVDERVTGNVRAGCVAGLMRQLRLGFGFFTDLEHKQGQLKQVGDARMSGLGGTLGLNFISRLPGQELSQGERKGTYSITLAARYAYFKGDVLGLRIAQAGQSDSIETELVDADINEVSAQVGVNGAW
jgi:hypothetical protein